jgi:hypothetical protein
VPVTDLASRVLRLTSTRDLAGDGGDPPRARTAQVRALPVELDDAPAIRLTVTETWAAERAAPPGPRSRDVGDDLDELADALGLRTTDASHSLLITDDGEPVEEIGRSFQGGTDPASTRAEIARRWPDATDVTDHRHGPGRGRGDLVVGPGRHRARVATARRRLVGG